MSDSTINTILIAVVAFLIQYFIIYIAIKDAIWKRFEPHLKLQSKCLEHLARQSGLDEKTLDQFMLTPKEWKSKYPTG